MFGSRLHSALTAAGHEVELIPAEPALRERLAGSDHDTKALIVDLTDERLDGAAVLGSLRAEGRLEGIRTLAFYSHVDLQAREDAAAADFDLAVPRSRMAREAAGLVGDLTAT